MADPGAPRGVRERPLRSLRKYASRVRQLGEILVHRGAIDEDQLEDALARQRELAEKGERKRVGELLIDMGLITDQDFQRAYEEQQANS